MTDVMGDPPERIEFYAHKATCRVCAGIVKMPRDQETTWLLPEDCFCLKCGKRYFVKTGHDIQAWEEEQWRQKITAPSSDEDSHTKQKNEDEKMKYSRTASFQKDWSENNMIAFNPLLNAALFDFGLSEDFILSANLETKRLMQEALSDPEKMHHNPQPMEVALAFTELFASIVISKIQMMEGDEESPRLLDPELVPKAQAMLKTIGEALATMEIK